VIRDREAAGKKPDGDTGSKRGILGYVGKRGIFITMNPNPNK
jgi:hypothetical protein